MEQLEIRICLHRDVLHCVDVVRTERLEPDAEVRLVINECHQRMAAHQKQRVNAGSPITSSRIDSLVSLSNANQQP